MADGIKSQSESRKATPRYLKSYPQNVWGQLKDKFDTHNISESKKRYTFKADS